LEHRVYWVLASLIAVAFFLDLLANGGAGFVFLARKLLNFVQVLAFWRH
jgi:hypothetical protein